MTADSVYQMTISNMQNFAANLDEPFSISEEQHQIDLDQLKKNISNEYFFFVMDISTASVTNVNGVALWLGYPDEYFTLKSYIHIMHPSQYLAYVNFNSNILQVLQKKDYDIKYMTHRFISNMVLRNAAGNYLLFKRIISPWQFDKNKKYSASLNEFYLLGEYRGESFNARASNRYNTKGVENTIGEEVKNMIQNSSEVFLPFGTQQYRILRMLAYQPELKEKEIGEILSLSKNTVHTHSTNILNIAREYLMQPFKTTKEVAAYLKNEYYF
ncbi:MAG TPA: hypothetical protein PK431_00895 [Chitinophagales bacterium]|nr:hypothetical protein [Chitinophagales bacterium]